MALLSWMVRSGLSRMCICIQHDLTVPRAACCHQGLAHAGMSDMDDLMAEVDTDCDGCINYLEFCEHLMAKSG